MAHQGKRMISEDLLAAIEAIKNSGVTAADLIAVAEALKDGDLQGKLTAGDNITITDENVISATDTTYTAGTNITIEDGVISATGGEKYYEHQLTLTNHVIDYLGEFHCDIISKDQNAYTKAQIENIFKTYFNNYDKSKIGIGRYRPNTSSDFILIYDLYHDVSQSKYYYKDVLTDTQVQFSVSDATDNVTEIKSFIA